MKKPPSQSPAAARHIGCRPERNNRLQPALWRRAVSQSWRQLLISALVLFLFAWVFVWLMSLFKWAVLVQAVPDFLKQLLGKDFKLFASPVGQVSVLFNHPITQLICMGWAIGRGSDVVAGEISRGTMEHLLALPVRRFTVLLVPSVVAAAGAALLAAASWAGFSLGLLLVDQFNDLRPLLFLPSAVNLGLMTFCFAGIATLFSSFDEDRWRVIWRTTGLYLISMIVFVVGFLWPAGWWLKCFTLHGAFQPQMLALKPDDVWTLPLGPLGGVTWPVAAWYNATLLVIGLAAYAAAATIFVRRDIPVPR